MVRKKLNRSNEFIIEDNIIYHMTRTKKYTESAIFDIIDISSPDSNQKNKCNDLYHHLHIGRCTRDTCIAKMLDVYHYHGHYINGTRSSSDSSSEIDQSDEESDEENDDIIFIQC
uniref:Uncharacterized protein n=1 Tax=viral metagenome TaxID=1070528 RepID=A0A6C0C7R2_9ZZZZ